MAKQLTDFKGHQVEQLLLEAQMGQIQDCFVVWKFGNNPSIGTIEEDIWHNGGVYEFPTIAEVLNVSSSDNSDNQTITIQGLDENYNLCNCEITLNGTTPVQTTETFIRVNRVFNSNGSETLGDITIANQSGLILATVPQESQQTLQAIYTVPAGYTGYVFRGMASLGKGKDGQIFFKARAFSRAFRVFETFGLYQATYEGKRPFIPITEKADLKVSAYSSSSGTDVSAQFGIILFKNSTWFED